MKYTPHIIAAVAVVVVATAALAATTSTTFEMEVNGQVKNIGSSMSFNSGDSIKITASQSVEYNYLITGDGILESKTIQGTVLTVDTSKIATHTISWTNVDWSDIDATDGGTITTIQIR